MQLLSVSVQLLFVCVGVFLNLSENKVARFFVFLAVLLIEKRPVTVDGCFCKCASHQLLCRIGICFMREGGGGGDSNCPVWFAIQVK